MCCSFAVMLAQLLGFGMGGSLSFGDPANGVRLISSSCFFSQCSLCLSDMMPQSGGFVISAKRSDRAFGDGFDF